MAAFPLARVHRAFVLVAVMWGVGFGWLFLWTIANSYVRPLKFGYTSRFMGWDKFRFRKPEYNQFIVELAKNCAVVTEEDRY